ncbi:MAG: hypothetical protein ACREXR_18720 [Gammaproteobacteria bacterium]
MQYDEEVGLLIKKIPFRNLLDLDAYGRAGQEEIGLAKGRKGRSPLDSPSPAML